MKLKIEGNRITASFPDEGRQDTFVVEAVFRYTEGQIKPSVVFVPRTDSGTAQAASDLRRVVRMIAQTQVVPWTGKPFPLPSAPVSGGKEPSGIGRMKNFPSLKKLGVIGAAGSQ